MTSVLLTTNKGNITIELDAEKAPKENTGQQQAQKIVGEQSAVQGGPNPTPGGVPVAITSPGSRVIVSDRNSINSGTPKIN